MWIRDSVHGICSTRCKYSLLGVGVGEALEIILIKPEGRHRQESVRERHETVKKTVKEAKKAVVKPLLYVKYSYYL